MKRTSVTTGALAVAAIAAILMSGQRGIAAPNPQTLFDKARKVAAAAKSLKAGMQVTITQGKQSGGMTGTVELLRPNFGRITLRGHGAMATGGTQRFVSNGKNLYVVSDKDKKFLKVSAEPHGENLFLLIGRVLTPIVGFTDPDSLRFEGRVESVTSETRKGKSYKKVMLTANEAPTQRALFFGASGLLEGIEYTQRDSSQSALFKVWLENVSLNPSLAAKQFAYAPPTGYTLRDTSPEGKLLALGSKAPEFNLPGAFGGKYALSALRKGKKATLISFWFHACGPCRIELPLLAKNYPQWKKRGLGIVAINTDDPAKLVQSYIFEEKLNYPVALAVDGREKILNAYRIEAFPTVYLLDQNGKIVWRKTGLDPDGLDAALEKALR